MEGSEGTKNIERHEDNDDVVIDIQPLEEQKTIELSNAIVREKIALRLPLMISFIILTTILSVAFAGANATAIKDVAITVIPELIVILGTVVGFYFGSKK